jgi:hypothetical protein
MHPPFSPLDRELPRDEIRAWAESEGKSATMRDDLYRRRQSQQGCGLSIAALFAIAEMIVTFVEAWRCFSS